MCHRGSSCHAKRTDRTEYSGMASYKQSNVTAHHVKHIAKHTAWAAAIRTNNAQMWIKFKCWRNKKKLIALLRDLNVAVFCLILDPWRQVLSILKGLAQAEIIKKSVILFRVTNMTI